MALIESVAEEAVAVKPQVAFFEALGGHGLSALERVCAFASEAGLIVIADAKRGDIGSTCARPTPRPGWRRATAARRSPTR